MEARLLSTFITQGKHERYSKSTINPSFMSTLPLNIPLLRTMISEGFVTSVKHPTEELYILNYSHTCQFSKKWNEVTLRCRGLIVDSNFKIIVEGLPKFFNMEELSELPTEAFTVSTKLDGSLGILYWIEDVPYIATRGSFASDQALHATSLLHSTYRSSWGKIRRDNTYLFEIIYPSNRIVVNYGSSDKLVLLTAIHSKKRTETLPSIGFPLVSTLDGIRDFAELKNRNLVNEEGYVVRFSSGLRMKIKFEDYIKLHSIIFHTSNVTIWEGLSEGKDVVSLTSRLPDEMFVWAKKVIEELSNAYETIETEALANSKTFSTRKETAEYIKTQPHSSVMFAMYAKKPYSKIIWKMIKPSFSAIKLICRRRNTTN